MMRSLTTDQKLLFKQYEKLGREIASNEVNIKNIWEIISNEGIWRLPIARQYGGKGQSWQDCIVALDGFFSQYPNAELLTMFISQISVLYLITQYGTETVRKIYLPRIIEGEIVGLFISKYTFRSFSRNNFHFHKKKSIHFCKLKNNISVYAKKIKNNVIFSIAECHPMQSHDNKSSPSLVIKKQTFEAQDFDSSILCDLINFERLLYGVLSANYAHKILKQYG